MAINLHTEKLIGLVEATKHLPKRRGRRVAATTIWRWLTSGCQGVRLEGEQTPAGWCTSVEALARFFERLRVARVGERKGMERPAERTAPAESWEMQQARARVILDAAGIGVAPGKRPA